MTYLVQPMAATQNGSYPSYLGRKAWLDPLACKLKVEGEGIVKVQPDIAVVILGVITENKQLKPAQEENAIKINGVIKGIRDMGIPEKDIQTQSYTIDLQYDYVEGKQIFRGYRVQHSLKIIIRDMGEIGKVIDEAVQNGANQVSSITFSLSDPSGLYQTALKAAVDDVLTKSRTLGDKLGVVVSKVPVQMVEKSTPAEGPKMFFLTQTAAPSTQIQVGQVEVIARLEAVFDYTRINHQVY